MNRTQQQKLIEAFTVGVSSGLTGLRISEDYYEDGREAATTNQPQKEKSFSGFNFRKLK